MKDKGFQYESEDVIKREFALATAYFKKYPNEVKISKVQWKRMFWFSAPPKHSFLNWNNSATEWDNNKILAIAHGKDQGGIIGTGGDSTVKYGMNRNMELFAVKIMKSTIDVYPDDNPTSNTQDPKKSELSLGPDGKLTESHEISKIGPRKANTKRVYQIDRKDYISLTHLGQSLDKKAASLSFEQKVDVARKAAWELYKLHNGDASLDKMKIAHLDTKPANIAVDESSLHVSLLDFGTAQRLLENQPIKVITSTADYDPTNLLIGNCGYQWMTKEPTLDNLKASPQSLYIRTENTIYLYNKWEGSLKKQDLSTIIMTNLEKEFPKQNDIEALSSDQLANIAKYTGLNLNTSVSDTLTNKRRLGPTGCDLFALKRTLYFPDRGIATAGLFSDEDYEKLSESVQDKIQASYITPEALDHIANESPLDLIFALIEQKLSLMKQKQNPSTSSEFKFPDDLSIHSKESICNMFALIDNIQEWKHSDLTTVTDNYLKRIMNVTQQSDLDAIQSDVASYNECLSLLTDISKCEVDRNDTEMKKFIDDYSNKLRNSKPADRDIIKNTLQEALDCVKSPIMVAIKAQVSNLYNRAYNPSTSEYTLGMYRNLTSKAKGIEQALKQVPILERGHIRDSDNQACKNLRAECAKNRLYAFYSGVKKGGNVNEAHASDTYKKIFLNQKNQYKPIATTKDAINDTKDDNKETTTNIHSKN